MEKSSVFKISFIQEPLFFVDEKRKTVACKMVGLLNGPTVYTNLSGNLEYDSLYKEIECVGVAKCSPNDKFDVNRGKRIALAKAENTIYRTAKTYIVETLELNYANLLSKTAHFIEKADWCIEHNEFYIDRLSNENNPEYVKETLPPKRGTEVKHS